MLLVCVLFWPVVTSIRGFSGLSWLQSVSSAEAGTVFSLYTHCSVSRQDLSLCAVASRLTLPLTVLRDRNNIPLSSPKFFVLIHKVNVKPVVMGGNRSHVQCDTHSQVLTGTRTGRPTATEHRAWDLWAWRHWNHIHNDTHICTCRPYILSALSTFYTFCERTWTVVSVTGYDLSNSLPHLERDCHIPSSGFEPPHRMTWYTPSIYPTDPSHRHLERAKKSWWHSKKNLLYCICSFQ